MLLPRPIPKHLTLSASLSLKLFFFILPLIKNPIVTHQDKPTAVDPLTNWIHLHLSPFLILHFVLTQHPSNGPVTILKAKFADSNEPPCDTKNAAAFLRTVTCE